MDQDFKMEHYMNFTGTIFQVWLLQLNDSQAHG